MHPNVHTIVTSIHVDKLVCLCIHTTSKENEKIQYFSCGQHWKGGMTIRCTKANVNNQTSCTHYCTLYNVHIKK